MRVRNLYRASGLGLHVPSQDILQANPHVGALRPKYASYAYM